MRAGDPATGGIPAGPIHGADDVDREVVAEEIHIAGVLVQCRPHELTSICGAVEALAAADIFQTSTDGKMVVVIEAPTSRDVLGVIDAIRALPGVLNVALVYQHAEPAADMQRPLEPPPKETI